MELRLEVMCDMSDAKILSPPTIWWLHAVYYITVIPFKQRRQIYMHSSMLNPFLHTKSGWTFWQMTDNGKNILTLFRESSETSIDIVDTLYYANGNVMVTIVSWSLT